MSGDKMMAIVTLGSGGYEQLSYQEWPKPVCGDGEVLVKVLACGCNNTEINTRLGWYSKKISKATSDTQGGYVEGGEGGWSAPTPFPFIQGTDVCGEVVASGGGVPDFNSKFKGRRCLIRSCQRGPEGQLDGS